jgi:AAA+ superfamily predicted ATPase
MLEEPQNLFEVNDQDKRFTENKTVSVSKATLGQFGEVLDSVMNPLKGKMLSMQEVFAEFLGCDIKDLQTDHRMFSGIKSKLYKYIITYKLEEYRKEELKKETEKVEECYNFQNRENQIINISLDKQVRIPINITLGIKKGSKKLVLQTVDDCGTFGLLFSYEKGSEKFVSEFSDHLAELCEKNNFYKGQKISPRLEFLRLGNKTWDDVILDDFTKERIKSNIVDLFKKEEIFKKNGISSKCGLIWEGLPGTGKTISAQVLAQELKDITFIWVTPSNVYGAEDVKNIYDLATELKPTIVFFEDADLFCKDRGYGGENQVLCEIMNRLDGIVPLESVATIFTSNDPNVLEKALIDRPGRFDERIVFNPPKKDQIIRMMEVFIQKPSYDKEDLSEIAARSEELHLTGAHIKRLCDLAVIDAIKTDSLDKSSIAVLTKENFEKAFETIKDMKIKIGEAKVEAQKQEKNMKLGPAFGPFREEAESFEESTVVESVQPEPRKSLISGIVAKMKEKRG